MGVKSLLDILRPNLTHAGQLGSCWALGKGLTTNGAAMFGPMFNPLPTQSRPSKIHSYFFDTLAYHYTGEAAEEEGVAQPFSLLHRGQLLPSRFNRVRRMSQPTPTDDFPFLNSATAEAQMV